MEGRREGESGDDKGKGNMLTFFFLLVSPPVPAIICFYQLIGLTLTANYDVIVVDRLYTMKS